MAELNINERQAGDVTVLDMSGKITIGEGSVALRTAVRRLLEEGKKRILLNLAGWVTSIRAVLVNWFQATQQLIKMADSSNSSISRRNFRICLTITKLLTVFDVYESEAEALNSFK